MSMKLKVTQRELETVVYSEPFLKRLNRAALATAHRGITTGFEVYRDLRRGNVRFSGVQPPVRGPPSMDVTQLVSGQATHFLIMDIQVKPYTGVLPVPDHADKLRLSEHLYGLNDRPIVGVASVDRHRDGTLLFIQRRYDNDQDAASVLEEFTDRAQAATAARHPDELAEMIRIPGYVAAEVLLFMSTNRGGRAVVTRAPDLARIAYEAVSVE